MRSTLLYLAFGSACWVAPTVHAQFISDNKSTQDLEYGLVLFDYFQKNYFEALIEQEYAQTIGNSIANASTGQILKGGMMLSYGMPDASKKIFEQLLQAQATEEISNKAWFYLAKMLYAKSDIASARDALNRVKGKVPDEIYTEYNYLVLLIAKGNLQVKGSGPISEDVLKSAQKNTPYYPYLLFNTAIMQLRNDQLKDAVQNLEKVTEYSGKSEELSVLSDRARHGLAELAIKYNRLDEAWNYLKLIRTNGLYSNRALLSYAWAAINLKRFGEAIPALEMLNNRSIAIPEVQEAIVLLAHVYEQEGLLKKALQANVNAENNYHKGVQMITEARAIIEKQDVPREFINNIEAMIDDSDWFNTKPSVDYKKLTPFLIDLMAGYQFRETLDELADLYAMESNLEYWSLQAEQHALILKNARQKTYDNSIKELLDRGLVLKEQLSEKNAELKLYTFRSVNANRTG
jgi:predicted Zn-dependent protease